jgi:hypothetical protein
MERSALQDIAAASRFDANTTYSTSVGSAPQGQLLRAREINNLPGAGASSMNLATQIDLSNGAPETIDWAGNTAPQWRRRPVTDGQHRDSLRFDGGYLVSGKGGDVDFRSSRKIPEQASQRRSEGPTIQGLSNSNAHRNEQNTTPSHSSERWISNSKASWGASFNETSFREEPRRDNSAADWKSSYQLQSQNQMHGKQNSNTSNERNPVGRSKSYRPCRKIIGPRVANLPGCNTNQQNNLHAVQSRLANEGQEVVDVSTSQLPREKYNMNGMSGDQLLSGINATAMARAIHKGALPIKSSSSSSSTTALSAGRRQVPKPLEWKRSRLPGFSFD